MAGPVCIVPAGDRTGEGLVWHAAENALYWTDINRFLIHRFDAATGAVKSWFFDEPVVSLGLTDRPGLLVAALGSRIVLWRPADDTRADFATPEKKVPRSRLNDGRPGPDGCFWVGSMFNNVGPDGGDIPITDGSLGTLYRVDSGGRAVVFKDKVGISNTICWSPDRRHFYFADTLRNELCVWNYDEAKGAIANERPFFNGFERGGPDGSSIDSEGYLWNARYGGGCVVRLTPDGKIDRVVDLPVGNITNCAFGGTDLKTLYITTAQGGSGPVERLAGSLYALAVEVPGLPADTFRLSGRT